MLTSNSVEGLIQKIEKLAWMNKPNILTIASVLYDMDDAIGYGAAMMRCSHCNARIFSAFPIPLRTPTNCPSCGEAAVYIDEEDKL